LNHLTAEDAATAPDVALGEFVVDLVFGNSFVRYQSSVLVYFYQVC
jgi:hypothetical protein